MIRADVITLISEEPHGVFETASGGETTVKALTACSSGVRVMGLFLDS